MDDFETIGLRKLRSVGHVVCQFTRSQILAWRPAVNAYLCGRGMKICVDLAGIDQSQIDLQVEPRRILIRGYRQAPEPTREEMLVQILAMEIDHGPFQREVLLPIIVDVEEVTAEQRNGFLWIWLPAKPANSDPTT